MLPLLGTLLLASLSTRPASDTVPLYTDLGSHHRAISTRVPKAQQYFDQGLRLVFGFNHGEAIRAFNEGARLDPNCAMCYWGTAYAYGPHVNAGMDSASGVAAYAAAQQGLAHLSHASPVEQALIRAVAKRYAAVPPADRAALDSAYARAMADVVKQFPNDLDAAALYAEALMDLRPWNYWKPADGSPYPGTETIVAQLERVLAKNPSHPGACHYYIHAVEAVAPEKAVPCAERLAALMPGVGHMVHMPGHIYIRVGRYADAIEANIHAVHTDEVYIEGQKPQGVYPLGYYPHNYHFLAFAATLAGRSAQAIDAAKKTAATTPYDVAKQVPILEPFVIYAFLTYVTFGRWEELLALPLPPADLAYSRGMAQYARGVAFAATGRWAEAQAALDTVKQIGAASTQGYTAAGWVTPGTNLQIAAHVLAGEIAARQGQLDDAIAHFREGIKLEDGLLYFEPPDWYYPIRHSIGAVLLKAGRAGEAETVYREDLKRFPENGWSLFGLAQALHAQNKHAEAAGVDARFRTAWQGADVTLVASRF
jgi:tetratricopeptide (TPR) repeat protein